MASQKSARRSRKRRAAGKRPHAVPAPPRRRPAGTTGGAGTGARQPGRAAAQTYGERPPSPFGGLPISEIVILAGAIGVIVGWLQSVRAALFAGVGACFLGVLEVTSREHFSGYRSHSTLLAGMAAVAVETLLGLVIVPGARTPLLIAVVPVFALSFLWLRRRFSEARQARVRALPLA